MVTLEVGLQMNLCKKDMRNMEGSLDEVAHRPEVAAPSSAEEGRLLPGWQPKVHIRVCLQEKLEDARALRCMLRIVEADLNKLGWLCGQAARVRYFDVIFARRAMRGCERVERNKHTSIK